MAIISYLQGLGATHLFTLDNVGTSTSDDLGNSSVPTNIISGTYSFQANPVCYGASHSVRTTATATNATDGATFANTNDININNALPYNSGTRTVILWFKQDAIQNVTCIYEQGGGANNFAFMGGAQTTFQAAHAGEPFLIAATKDKAIANRAYFLAGVWEYYTQHAGSGNRVIFYVNGVLQEIAEENGTATFPSHGGDIALGNSKENLKSFAETVLTSQTTAKNCNYLGMYNNTSLTEAQCRNIFERMVIPEVVIAADTVANQQAALNALSGTTYQNVNCAIEIRQATDATDYTLTLNNITFVQNPNLKDIAVQYVGPNTLTLINANSNAVEVSTPVEKDLDGGTTVLTGGGTINLVPLNNVSITGITAGSRLQIYNVTTAAEVVNTTVAGTSYTATYAEGTGYNSGDTVRIRLTQTSTTTAKLPFETTVLATDAGWTALVSQEDDAVYNALAVDGSTVTTFTADYTNDQVDIVVATNFNISDFYAWWVYNLTTEGGIREFFGGVTAEDQANFRINSGTLNLFLDNTTTTNIRQLDNRRFYREDLAYPVLDPTTGGGGIDVVWRDKVFVAGLGDVEGDLNIINQGVQKASILVPHTTNL